MRRRLVFSSSLTAALVVACSTSAAGLPAAGALTRSPKAVTNQMLNSVACVTRSRCLSAGYYGSTVFDDVPVIERWKSSRWTRAKAADDTGDPTNALYAVTCATATFCWAVGSSGSPELEYSPLAELWNGDTWAVAATPYTGSDVGLDSVACVSRSDCWAVGGFIDGYGAHAAYAERWTESDEGSHWAQATPAIPAGATASGLASVACEGSRDCNAVGSYTTSKGVDVTLAEHFDGTSWKVTPTPNPKGSTGSYLDALSCAGPANCTAVGYYGGSGAILDPSLAEHWDGTKWSLMSTPNVKTAIGGSILNSIACSSATSCTSVGHSSSSAGHFTLVEQLRASKWRIVATPNPRGATGSFLNGVACTSASSCDSVGYSVTTSGEVNLAEHWDGSKWAIVRTASK